MRPGGQLAWPQRVEHDLQLRADVGVGRVALLMIVSPFCWYQRYQGVVVLKPEEIVDSWVRQVLINEAIKRYGPRPGVRR